MTWSSTVNQPEGRPAGLSSSTLMTSQKAMTTSPILVVDDDAAIRATIADILGLEGYAVETAANGLEALERVGDRRPSIIVLDMRMPIMDGWTFARELQARGFRIPIIVITAAQNARSWAQEIGADAYLAKPFELTDLLDAVERLDRQDPPGS